MEAAHRSIHPNVPGVPWWAAVLIATTATAIGYAIDAALGHKELTNIFAGLYIAGCVIAVVAVRQAGVFTAVIQPPLILFCAVPGAYWLFHGGKVRNVKDLLINCGYPLIERFPLMVGTAGGVVLIGLVRWYFGTQMPSQPSRARAKQAAEPNDDAAPASAGESRSRSGGLGRVAAKLTGFLRRDHDDLADESPSLPPTGSPRVEPGSRPPRTSRPARGGRTGARSARTHSRHARPAQEDEYGPATERPRRQSRRRQPPQTQPAPDFDAADPPRRQRRRPQGPRPKGDPDPRAQQPQEPRRRPQGPRSQGNPYERPTSRSGRYDPYDGYEPSGPPEQYGSYQRPYEQREPHQSYEQPRRRGTPNSANPNHHPISQVRYRGSGGSTPRDEPRSEPRSERRSERHDEPLAERRNRSRGPGRPQNRHSAENWEYDI